jgi:hypothetical protein
MKLSTLKFATLTTAAAGIAWLSSSSAPAGEGSPVEYTFRDAPINSLGIKSMAELRGKPIVIDFWGRN